MSKKISRPHSKHPIPPHAKRVFRGEIFDVYQWQQKLFDGTFATFEMLKRSDSVQIISLTKDGKIIVTSQEQPRKGTFLTTIGGRIEQGEEPIAAAKRELLEEAGYKAKRFHLWDARSRSSKIDWVVYTLIAYDCEKVAEPTLDAGEKIELKLVTFDEFIEIALDVRFRDDEITNKILRAKIDSKKMDELKRLLKV